MGESSNESWAPWLIDIYQNDKWWEYARFSVTPLDTFESLFDIFRGVKERRPDKILRLRNKDTGDIIMGDIL